jgi:hypothetical protein
VKRALAWAALLATAAAAAGCSFSADYAGTQFQCHGDAGCPGGLACIEGTCGGTPSIDGAAADAAIGMCAGHTVFLDSFDGDLAQWNVTTIGGATIEATGSELTVTPVGAESGGSAETIDPYAFGDGSAVGAQVDALGDFSSSTERLILRDSANDVEAVQLYRDNFDLHAEADPTGEPAEIAAQVPYEPGTQTFWLIRRTGGQILFFTSPDGATWTQLGVSVSALQVPTGLRLDVGAKNYDGPLEPMTFGGVVWCGP